MRVCVVALALTSLAAAAAGQERMLLSALVSEALASHPRVLAAERRAGELVVYPPIYEIWKWHFGLKQELAPT